MKIWNKKNGVILLVVVLLITAFARCFAGKAGLPKAKGFEKYLNNTIQRVLDTKNIEVTDYNHDGNMITCNLAGVLYTAVVREGKVISLLAVLDYDLLSAFSGSKAEALTTMLLMPAAVFDSSYSTPKDLAMLMSTVQSYQVENTAESTKCIYTNDGFEYSYTAGTYSGLFTGYMFQVRYID